MQWTVHTLCYYENNSDNYDGENGKKWSKKNLISIVFVLSSSRRAILYNEDTSINVKTWARATKQVDAYENEGITQWYQMTSLMKQPWLTETTTAEAAVTALHIKFNASNVTYCENESKLMRLILFLFSVHGGHSYMVCIKSSLALASELCACAKNQINFIAFSCLILSTVECYLWPCIPDDNTTDKPINLYLSGAANEWKEEGKSHKGYGLIWNWCVTACAVRRPCPCPCPCKWKNYSTLMLLSNTFFRLLCRLYGKFALVSIFCVKLSMAKGELRKPHWALAFWHSKRSWNK